MKITNANMSAIIATVNLYYDTMTVARTITTSVTITATVLFLS